MLTSIKDERSKHKEQSMLLQVQKVRYLGAYRLRVFFNNQIVKDVNLQDELDGEIFEPLQDLETFRQVAVNPDTNTIEWLNGADFAPEFLFEIGQIVVEPQRQVSEKVNQKPVFSSVGAECV
jgi:hypothetical protein